MMRDHKPISIADQVFEKLERDILSGKYPQGEILSRGINGCLHINGIDVLSGSTSKSGGGFYVGKDKVSTHCLKLSFPIGRDKARAVGADKACGAISL